MGAEDSILGAKVRFAQFIDEATTIARPRRLFGAIFEVVVFENPLKPYSCGHSTIKINIFSGFWLKSEDRES